MTQERIIFSNPTSSNPRLSPAATKSDDILSARAPPLHSASILQPATPPQVVAFESWTISAPICLNGFTLAESRKPDLWNCVCFLTIFLVCLAFVIKVDFSFESLFAIWSLSPQWFHYSFYLSIVSWQYQKYWNILILVLCLLLVCSSYSSFAPPSPFFNSQWHRDCELFTHTLVPQCSPSTSSRQPQTLRITKLTTYSSLKSYAQVSPWILSCGRMWRTCAHVIYCFWWCAPNSLSTKRSQTREPHHWYTRIYHWITKVASDYGFRNEFAWAGQNDAEMHSHKH